MAKPIIPAVPKLANRPLVQSNIHPEAGRSSGTKPAQHRFAQPIGNGVWVLPVGGSRKKP
mgnify:CR=1 FL=1